MRNERGLSEIWIAILVVAAMVAAPFVYYGVLPWFMGQQYSAERRSQPYVQTQQAGLVLLMTQYQSAQDEDHRRAILVQMRQLATTIQPDQVPPAVSEFLAAHP